MVKYVVKRVLEIIPVIIIVAIIIFTIMYFCPGDPAEIIAGAGATGEEKEYIRESMGLNRPFMIQLGEYLYKTFLRLDFGSSYITGLTVWSELQTRMPKTLLLATLCLVGQVIIGIPLGIAAAQHQGKAIDYLCMFIAMIGVSIPTFWLAQELILGFTLQLNWLPGYGTDSWKSWILPVISGMFSGVAMQARQSRSSMLECIRSDYVRTARAKGLPERTITFKYVLPNGMIPILQVIGQSFGGSLGGTVIIENVFAIAGIGTYISQGITNRDYPVVRGSVVFLSIWFCLIMLLVDLAFAFVDPRIKAQYENASVRKKVKKGGSANA